MATARARAMTVKVAAASLMPLKALQKQLVMEANRCQLLLNTDHRLLGGQQGVGGMFIEWTLSQRDDKKAGGIPLLWHRLQWGSPPQHQEEKSQEQGNLTPNRYSQAG